MALLRQSLGRAFCFRLEVQGGLENSKISGVGTNFGLLVYVVPGPNKQRAFEPIMLLS
jgi:hypothetical protein